MRNAREETQDFSGLTGKVAEAVKAAGNNLTAALQAGGVLVTVADLLSTTQVLADRIHHAAKLLADAKLALDNEPALFSGAGFQGQIKGHASTLKTLAERLGTATRELQQALRDAKLKPLKELNPLGSQILKLYSKAPQLTRAVEAAQAKGAALSKDDIDAVRTEMAALIALASGYDSPAATISKYRRDFAGPADIAKANLEKMLSREPGGLYHAMFTPATAAIGQDGGVTAVGTATGLGTPIFHVMFYFDPHNGAIASFGLPPPGGDAGLSFGIIPVAAEFDKQRLLLLLAAHPFDKKVPAAAQKAITDALKSFQAATLQQFSPEEQKQLDLAP
jgi:hypothetical protein